MLNSIAIILRSVLILLGAGFLCGLAVAGFVAPIILTLQWLGLL